MSRVVSALSLDGHRIATELTISFRRPIATDTANALADEAARSAAYVLGNQICQGELPLDKTELLEQVLSKTPTIGKVAELQIAALALLGHNTPTRSTARSLPGPSLARHSGTIPPPAVPRRSISGLQPAADLTVPPLPAAASGFRPRQAVRTLWPSALAGFSGQHTPEELASLLGAAMRDSAATAVFLILLAADPQRVTRLPAQNALSRDEPLRHEAGACFSAALRRVLIGHQVNAGDAHAIAQGAWQHAFGGGQWSCVESIERYAKGRSPVSELSQRIASLLKAPDEWTAIYQAIAPYCQTLRSEFADVALHIRRLTG